MVVRMGIDTFELFVSHSLISEPLTENSNLKELLVPRGQPFNCYSAEWAADAAHGALTNEYSLRTTYSDITEIDDSGGWSNQFKPLA